MEESEEARKVVKKIIEPKEDGWQIKSIRGVRKGGLVIETETKKTAEKLRKLSRQLM